MTAFAFTAMAQTNYRVGMGSASIEPDHSIFSTALAGYGLPREGRFSITWNSVEAPSALKTLAGDGHVLYALSDTQMWEGRPGGNGAVSWSLVGERRGLRTVFGADDGRYALDARGAVLRVDGGRKQKSRKMRPGVSLTTVTVLDARWYGADGAGNMWQATSPENEWKQLKSDGTGTIVSLTTDGKTLYALNRGDSLFMANPADAELAWTMIGRNNGVTFNIDVSDIGAAGGRLYALASDGKVYANAHATDGNLSAQAIAVEEGGRKVIIAVADVCGFEYAFIQEIKQAVARKHGIPAEAVLINATHTHFAPITQDFGPMGPFYEVPSARYMDVVRNGILAAVDEAIAHLKPTEIYFGRGTTDIGKNRRASAISNPPYDNTLDVVSFRNADEQAVLFSAACHPVFRNADRESFTLSANYPGVARKEIAGGKIKEAVFIQGCGGDINPADADHRVTGKKLAHSVGEVLNTNLKKISGNISWSFDTISIPVAMWSKKEVEAYKAKALEKSGDLEAARDIRWADKMLGLYAQDSLPDALAVYVQTIDIGSWRLVGLSREVVNEYGPAIRALWPDRHVTVAGYCNDVTSYLPNDWHISTDIYEGKGSFFWYGAHGPFPSGTFDTIIRTIGKNAAAREGSGE